MGSMGFGNGESVLLTENHVYFGGMNLTYQLFAVRGGALRRFWIRVAKEEEFDVADAGMDLMRAVELYRLILEGTVTPCTLSEVMQDLLYA